MGLSGVPSHGSRIMLPQLMKLVIGPTHGLLGAKRQSFGGELYFTPDMPETKWVLQNIVALVAIKPYANQT